MSGADHPTPHPGRSARTPSLDEQAHAKGTRPIGDGSFYVREDAFPEPGELEEFLEYVREGRRLGTVWPEGD